MKNPTLAFRLKTYFIYSFLGMLLAILSVPFDNADILFLPFPIIFNVIIFLKFNSEKKLVPVAIISGAIGIIFFLIQLFYRERFFQSCIFRADDETAYLSYSSTTLLFSICIWEIGFARITKATDLKSKI